MSFVDELTIYAKAGDGGNGIVSWRKEKYRPKGGPAGGNGGNGGDVYFRAVQDLTRLADYSGNPNFKAKNGGDGMRNSKAGANQDPMYIEVPIGSIITNRETGESFSLLNLGEEHLALRGGRGGYGNEHFKSSVNTTPYEQTDGKKGEEAEFYIELQLLVDVGFVGFPSAGKSSLVNALTGSRMKEAEYPFTTLEPGLGMFHGYVLADIPGLIEGASQGRGLGHKFLRHIRRTRAIVHLVSFEHYEQGGVDALHKAYKDIRNELGEYSPELLDKSELVILSKSDVVSAEEAKQAQALLKEMINREVVTTSILDDESIAQCACVLSQFLESQASRSEEEEKEED
ncbi:MAG: Obg family GTPase CgtA [Patescibacteria group bacterium]